MTKYEKLTKVTARAVESLVHCAAMIDATGAVSELLKTEPRIWEYLPEDTLTILRNAYGLTPAAEPPQRVDD